MSHAAIGPISVQLPERVETNEELQSQFPHWDMALIASKTGIKSRRIAAPGETASDLGVQAAEKLFAEHDIDRESIDFLLFCTQSPDFPLPTTACLMQSRLKLRTNIGALDFNLGCSGYVYGLGLAEGLIRAGSARRVLLITAETYSRYIAPDDRSLRTIFGDGAAATLIEANDEPSLGGFVFGTDGAGANCLFVNQGGARSQEQWIQPRKRQRWGSPLYMDGPALIDFTVEAIPSLVEQVFGRTGLKKEDIQYFILHQATLKMLDLLRERLGLPQERMPIVLEEVGNTVSSTIPIAMKELRDNGLLRPGSQTLLIGFGVGLSWAGCAWKETWVPRQALAENGKSASHEPHRNGWQPHGAGSHAPR